MVLKYMTTNDICHLSLSLLPASCVRKGEREGSEVAHLDAIHRRCPSFVTDVCCLLPRHLHLV